MSNNCHQRHKILASELPTIQTRSPALPRLILGLRNRLSYTKSMPKFPAISLLRSFLGCKQFIILLFNFYLTLTFNYFNFIIIITFCPFYQPIRSRSLITPTRLQKRLKGRRLQLFTQVNIGSCRSEGPMVSLNSRNQYVAVLINGHGSIIL